MPYKTRRQNRYETLRKAGFVGFEARALSRVSQRVPYMLPLMKVRHEEYQRAIKHAQRQGLTETEFNKQWQTHIKRRYVARGWKRRSDVWGVTVGFRMLKDAEKEFKYKHPAYDSPWQKRRKQWRDFVAKLEATYEKYPKGGIYGKKKPTTRIRYKPEGGAEVERE